METRYDDAVMAERTFQTTIASPVGDLHIEVDASGALIRLAFSNGRKPAAARVGRRTPIEDPARCAHVITQLDEYFTSQRQRFELEVRFDGTPFQRAIWRELQKIPFGTTITYRELARRAGYPGAARAAGSATGKNPVAIVIPCHRVVASDGSLGGFAGGAGIKAALLDLEGIPTSGRGCIKPASRPLDAAARTVRIVGR